MLTTFYQYEITTRNLDYFSILVYTPPQKKILFKMLHSEKKPINHPAPI